VDAGADQAICGGSSIMLGGAPTASGGSGSYTYEWSPATGLNDAHIANPTASPSSTTEYTLVVTDSKGCRGSDKATVTTHEAPVADAGPDQSACNGEMATLGGNPAASGGQGPYTYSWSPATGLDDPTAANPHTSLGAKMTYVLTVTDANGCTATDAVDVNAFELPVANAGVDKHFCMDQSATIGRDPTA